MLHAFKLSDITSFLLKKWISYLSLIANIPILYPSDQRSRFYVTSKKHFLSHLDWKLEFQIYISYKQKFSCKFLFNPLLHAFKLLEIKSLCIFFWFLIYPLAAISSFFTCPTSGQDLAVQTKHHFLGHLDRKLEWQIYINFCTDL